jgi:pimeloyl-ACP methyl ester carboxylesterase
MSLARWRETGGEFTFKGHRIFTRMVGAGDDALLLLHGFPTGSWDFEAIWPLLVRRFPRIITLDLLGMGFSDRPARHRYSILEQADLVEALLADCGVRRLHLLAHDYGARVAQELLARAIERGRAGAGPRPASCVMLNAALFPEAQARWRSRRLLMSLLGPGYLRLAGARGFGRAFSALFGPDTKPGMIELHDYWTLVNDGKGLHSLGRLLRDADERRQQRERWVRAVIEAPAPLRLIFGAADTLSIERVATRYRERATAADIVMLDGIGHYPHVEAPDRTARAILSFHEALDAAC